MANDNNIAPRATSTFAKGTILNNLNNNRFAVSRRRRGRWWRL